MQLFTQDQQQLKFRSRQGFILVGVLGSLSSLLLQPVPGRAQLIPDESLGNERSRVIEDVRIQGQSGDRIRGGARRGNNLFHSFESFNVDTNQRVYFSNPNNIDRIITRVTGNDASDILGTLGVDGAADLFLMNPNGIIFGPNARLDLNGAFLATTADQFLFPGEIEFSAVDPQAPPLLAINVPLGVQYGTSNP